MNLTNYLSRVAMANTEALGRTEMAKQRMEQELARKQEEAQGQAIGGLAGAVLGAGIGAYQKYNAGEESADALRGFQSRADFNEMANRPSAEKEVVDSFSPAAKQAVGLNQAFRQEAAAATEALPRISQTKGLFSKPEVREVRNDPVRDWEKLNAEDGERAADMLGLDMGRFIRRNLR